MSQHKQSDLKSHLPKAIAGRNRITYFIWLVPIAAAGFAAWLFIETMVGNGPTITIRFKNADGVQTGKTPVKYLGAKIGNVTSVALGQNDQVVLVKVELDASASKLASKGSEFWIVRPQISAQGISGLGSIVSGDYIAAKPGNGPRQKEFTALTEPPPFLHHRDGITIKVLAAKRGSLQEGSPVYYRGIKVGEVLDCKLSADSRAVICSVKIEKHYEPLVRSGSEFWNAGGVDVNAGLLGINVQVAPMKAMFGGGIAFATPDPPGNFAKDGMVFALHEKAADEWEQWAPVIHLPESNTNMPAQDE